MSETIIVKGLIEQVQKIHETADFLRKRTVEKGDDKGTQEYTRAYATGMEKAADIIMDYLNEKEAK